MPHPMEDIFPFPAGLTEEEKVEFYEFTLGLSHASLGAEEDMDLNMLRGRALARRYVKIRQAPAAAASESQPSDDTVISHPFLDSFDLPPELTYEEKVEGAEYWMAKVFAHYAPDDAKELNMLRAKKYVMDRMAEDSESLQPGDGDPKVKAETFAAKEAKSTYREAKKKAATVVPLCGYCNKEVASADDGNKQYKMCSECLSVAYCSKECQKADWKKGHKKVCKNLSLRRLQDSQPTDVVPQDLLNDIPTCGIVLPTSLTGYPKGVLVNIPAWDFNNYEQQSRLLDEYKTMDKEARAPYRASIIQAIQYFFKREKLGLSQDLSTTDICNMCYDTTILFWLGYPGVREPTHEEMKDASSTFSLFFQNHTPVPKDWKLDPTKMIGVSPEQIARWERGIEATRNDPDFLEMQELGLS